jgi:predicted DNA binding CopG/RHH family protein
VKGRKQKYMKKISKIPIFKNYAEEADFWDTHDFTEFVDELTPVKVKFNLSQPKEETLTIRLQANLKQRLSNVAEEMGVNTSTLARMWIVEKIKQAGIR